MLNETSPLVREGRPIAAGLWKVSSRSLVESWYWALPTALLVYCALDVVYTKFLVKRLGRMPQGSIPVSNGFSAAPRFINNLVFAFRSAQHLQHSYRKFGHASFQVARNNSPFIVLPPPLLEELASLPSRIANPSASLQMEFLGHLNGFDIIDQTNLQRIAAQRRLTSRMPLLVPSMEKSLSEDLHSLLPDSEEWTEFKPVPTIQQVSAKISSETIVGPRFRSDAKWLEIAIHYTEGVVLSALTLKFFPEWMQWWLSLFLPVCYQGARYLRSARKILGPRILERIADSDSGEWEPRDDNPEDADLLSWMCHTVKGPERNPDTISHVAVILALASVHTTSQRLLSLIFDIAADPLLRDMLLEEIAAVSRDGWDAASYDKLEKMESVMIESQRTTPPLVTGVRRLFMEDYTFKNGTFVRSGTHVCMATHAIENDEKNFAKPEVFDGLRTWRARREREKAGGLDSVAAREFLFSTPTPTGLSFGYGKNACPGRFFASAVIKIALVKLLTEYEFRFMPGAGKPAYGTLHEHSFVQPSMKMLIRRRKGGSAPF